MLDAMKAEIEALASHPHLGRVIGSHDRPCVLEIWFLRVRLDAAEATHLLYGRMLPADYIGDTWNGRAEDDFRQVDGDLRAEVGRVNLFTTAGKATAFLIAFYSGRCFADASADAGIRVAKPVGNRYSTVTLNGGFRLRPPMHLPSRDYYRFESARLSPSAHISATSASLSWLGKSSLFRIGDSSFPKLAGFCTKRLNEETGLEFQDLDAWRLGDFELLVLPAMDDSEQDAVVVAGPKEEITLSIERELMQVRAAGYQVRFDFMNDECLVHTIVEVLAPAQFPLTVTISAPPEVTSMVDAYRLSIDAQCANDLAWYPCVRWGAYLAREVNLQIGVDGGDTRIKWDWLSSTVRSAHQKRLQIVEQFARQKLTSGSVIGSRKGDAWVPANRQIRAWTRTLVPKESSGRFFLTYAEGEGDGRLELVEWLRALLREHADKQFAWFDPYMEDVGVNLLATQGLGSGNFIVLTNCPPAPRKRDWVDHIAKFLRTAESKLRRRQIADKPKLDRMANLLAAAKKWERAGIGGRFRIAYLPPETLHDRMILVTNGRNEPVVGYHLSNSIQLANENYPLLITPIPADVLQQVASYMEALLSCTPGTGAEARSLAEIVYDSDALDKEERRKRKGLFDYPETATVLAWWLQEPALAKFSASELRAELQKRDVLEGDSLRSADFEQVPQQLFTDALPFQDFNAAWAAMGILLASSMSGDSIDAAVMSAPPPDTLNQLEDFLGDRAQAEAIHRAGDAFPYLDDELKAPISTLLVRSSRYLSAFSPFTVDVAWGDYYAIKLLWQAAPDRLAAWVRKTANETWKDDMRRQFCLKCAIGVLAHSIGWGCSRQQLDALFTSPMDFLRWMGFVAVEANLIGGQNSLQSIYGLPGVQGPAKAQLMGWLLARSAQSLDKVTYAALVADYLAALPPQVTKSDLQDSLSILQGHMDRLFGGDLDVFALLIVPLVEADRLSVNIATEAWVNELLRCWDNKDLSLLFRARTEWPFTEQAGYLLAYSDDATQKRLLKALTSQAGNWKRFVQRPLGGEADWSALDRSFRLLMWTNNLLKSAYINLPRPHQQESSFTGVINDLDAVLQRRAVRDWERFGSADLYQVHKAFAALV